MNDEHDLRPGAREIVDRARAAQTPNDARRERAYEALMAGIAGGAALGAAKVGAAKVAGNAAFSAIRWLRVSAGIAALGFGGYVISARGHVAPAPPAATVSARSPVVTSAPPDAGSAAPPSESAATFASAAPLEPIQALSASSPASKAPPNKTNTGDLSAELSLLHQALAASRAGHPARALALAQEHAQEFPSSHLGVERDAIEVRSLCSLGRAAEAHKLADRLQARAPSSPVRAALEETCVGN